ncbi:MAG: MotA/TolQ/ExbB proton channel family protein [Planctomycetales bacterium]|nr:MotA/TolQ/ExbB proton channel family protein [Planctomycetales bacterium]
MRRQGCLSHERIRFRATLTTVLVWTLFSTSSLWSQGPANDVRSNAVPDHLASGVALDQPAESTEVGVATGKTLFDVVRSGGPILIPIGVCSMLLLVFAFERTISLRRNRVIPKPFVERFVLQLQEKQIDQDAALDLCNKSNSPIATVFAAAVKKWNRPSVEVEQAVLDTGERVANNLRKYLRLFNGISTVCPLLGLLGTVLGMISAFDAIATAEAMGKPELLASGISQALLTTAAGLSVAIPALICYLIFLSRVDKLVIEIDALGQDVVNAIASDGWKEKAKPTKRTRAKKAA